MIENLAARIRDKWVFGYYPHPPEIITAASLAHHGLLGSVEWLYLKNLDLASVPAEHLASLASCVTSSIGIINVSNCDIISFLASVKCGHLIINRENLNSEETQALVQAMESRVKRVICYFHGLKCF